MTVADGGAPDGGGTTGCTATPSSCGTGFVCQPFDDGTGGTIGMCVRTRNPVGDGIPDYLEWGCGPRP